MKLLPTTLGKIASIAVCAISLTVLKGFSQDPDFYIFLAFGQSNMEGYPGVEAQDKTGVPTRFQLLPAVNWPDNSRTKGTWTTAIPPLCRGNGPGLCPCDYFGRTMVDSLPEKIKVGIVNVSVAGCAIEMFDKDKYQTYISSQAQWMKDIVTGYGGNPYALLVEMGKAAQKDGVIKGFLFHQGESGSSTGQWANEVKIVYNNLIKDLGLDSAITPLLAGDLVRSSTMVKDLPKTLKAAHVVSSQGCEGRSDGLHFTAAGYRELGRHYADTMLNILKKLPTRVSEDKEKAVYNMENSLKIATGTASFSFKIPERAFVTLKAYSLSGKEIVEIARGEYAAGKHTVHVGRKNLPMGMFVLRMQSGSFSAMRTILLNVP